MQDNRRCLKNPVRNLLRDESPVSWENQFFNPYICKCIEERATIKFYRA